MSWRANEADEPMNEQGRWANQAYDGEVAEADEADLVGKSNMVNEAGEASLAEANESLANGGIAVAIKYSSKLLTFHPISLTKYGKIFAKVEGYFRMNFDSFSCPWISMHQSTHIQQRYFLKRSVLSQNLGLWIRQTTGSLCWV